MANERSRVGAAYRSKDNWSETPVWRKCSINIDLRDELVSRRAFRVMRPRMQTVVPDLRLGFPADALWRRPATKSAAIARSANTNCRRQRFLAHWRASAGVPPHRRHQGPRPGQSRGPTSSRYQSRAGRRSGREGLCNARQHAAEGRKPGRALSYPQRAAAGRDRRLGTQSRSTYKVASSSRRRGYRKDAPSDRG
jgi:hypothetical protein